MAPNILFENTGNSNHWLNVKLVDTRSNTITTAYGARVEVYAPNKQIREVTSQTGAGGQNCLRQHFGLGSRTTVDSVVVRWLSNSGNNTRVHTAYSHLPADRFMVYTYGDLNVSATVLAQRTFMYLAGNTGAAVEFTSNSATSNGTLTIQRHTSAPGNNTFSGSATAPDGSTVTPNITANDRYWTISQSGLTDHFTATIYLDISNMGGVSNRDKLVILSRENSSSPWVPHNTQRIGNTLYTTGVTTFSEWTVGANSADNSLPVTLLSFTASEQSGTINLAWKTASEIENLGYILERASTTSASFKTIASYKTHSALRGQGNTSFEHQYQYCDSAVAPNTEYVYRLRDVSYSGQENLLATVKIKTANFIVKNFKLYPAYPNPFNPAARITFQIPNAGKVTLQIYDNLGKLVTTLLNEHRSAGKYQLTFSSGAPSAGIYYCVMRSGRFHAVQKLIYLK